MVNKIWVEMSTTNLYDFHSKFKVICKNGDFGCQCINTHSKEKRNQKFLTSHSPISIYHIISYQTLFQHHYIKKLVKVFFSHQNVGCHSEYFGIYISWLSHQIRLKMGHSSPKNSKCRVCQSQVYYLHTTHLGPLKLAYRGCFAGNIYNMLSKKL